eukprot:TRINITY_DN27388_c0_g1_i2.p1 TRINITY_DN27388_c0_g1~~TRINITY_DN27388_c0_g1_i2.p1  ORF type:complete len:140 (+),score=19.60 TRINITY_DN27388_c0_g1_i2:74-493(+)
MILGKAETFSTCTGEDILVIAIDEDGEGQHWGTPAFQKFLKDPRVQDLMLKHLTHEPCRPSTVMSDSAAEFDHLSALLREQVAKLSPFGINGSLNWEHRPDAWPAEVPFCDPKLLSHQQVLKVLKVLHFWQQGEEPLVV